MFITNANKRDLTTAYNKDERISWAPRGFKPKTDSNFPDKKKKKKITTKNIVGCCLMSDKIFG